jgi:hypothetical protein
MPASGENAAQPESRSDNDNTTMLVGFGADLGEILFGTVSGMPSPYRSFFDVGATRWFCSRHPDGVAGRRLT